MLIRAIPQALAETQNICSSVNVGSTKTGLNMDAIRLMGQVILEAAEATKDADSIGCAKLVVLCNAPDDNPFMAGAFHGVSEADAISIAQSALLEQFGVTPDKLAMMETEVYCQIDYCFFDEPTRSWFVRFVDNVDDYQVYLRASDGTVTDISNQGSVLGAG